MSQKDSSLKLIGVAGFLSLVLTACLSAHFAGPSVTPKSAETVCRFGPGPVFASIATLKVGRTAQILGSMPDHSWWKIKDPLASGMQCWVADSAVNTSGDLSNVPIASIPAGQVSGLTIHGPPVIHTDCEIDEDTNPITFTISMTTNGPAMVSYHLEVYNAGRTMLLAKTTNASLSFASASTQIFNPGSIYRTDCGNFIIEVKVSSPNTVTAQTSWSVVKP